MTTNQQQYAAFIISELVAEADNGHVRETSAVVMARHWLELEGPRAEVRSDGSPFYSGPNLSPSGETVRGT